MNITEATSSKQIQGIDVYYKKHPELSWMESSFQSRTIEDCVEGFLGVKSEYLTYSSSFAMKLFGLLTTD